MDHLNFSSTYFEARQRFGDASREAGATMSSYLVLEVDNQKFSIDVAVIGPESKNTIVVSSGVHGVEGFFGSAVQLAYLKKLGQRQRPTETNVRYVFLHAVNPYGFAHLRRFNEDNVDLNRNFLYGDQRFSGAPAGYVKLNAFLNPKSGHSPFEMFKLKALWKIYMLGLPAFKEAVASGQYDYPSGIFFGGKEPAATSTIIKENCHRWIGDSKSIVHVDFHTGLGKYGGYKLLLAEDASAGTLPWYEKVFGEPYVEPLSASGGTAYRVSGLFGEWMQKTFEGRDYRFVAAEFGTYDPIRVLGAIRAENRAHHFGKKGSRAFHAAKKELLECFCPDDKSWRTTVLNGGVTILEQASAAAAAK